MSKNPRIGYLKFPFLFSVLMNILISNVAVAQLKKITLEDIWVKNTFEINSFDGYQWMKSGETYAKLINTKRGYEIVAFAVKSGKKLKTIVKSTQLIVEKDSLPISVEDFEFSADEKKILFKTTSKEIYRYSEMAKYVVYDIASKKLFPVANSEYVENATLSPDGQKIAYTKANNLYYCHLMTQTETAITTSGEKNKLIHGHSDWVYEEELELVRAYEWCQDSKKIAFMTFDESKVKEYNMQKWSGLYPQDYKYKYPKAGEKNAEVSLSVYDLETQKLNLLINGKDKDQYIPRINWTQDPNILSVRILNRNQDSLRIIHYDLNSQSNTTMQTIWSPAYVEVDDDFFYLKSDNSLIIAHENDGFRHIYRYAKDGKIMNQITKGQWEVSGIVGIDEANKLLFYTSKEQSSMENQLYSVDFQGNNKKKLTKEVGVHKIDMNTTNTHFIDYWSGTSDIQVALYNTKGDRLKDLELNAGFKEKWSEYENSKVEYGVCNTSNAALNYCTMKPSGFDSTKKYPVFMFVYGGPGSQQVLKSWHGRNRLWFEMLAQKGYIVAFVDNRGTGGKGAAFKNVTTRQLGKLETEDQIGFARYLSSKLWVDSARIGIFGWSYGGYLSSLCLLFGADVYKMAIAVAPVTNWRFYDTIYTERFLKTPEENPMGYDAYSPTQNADKLKGKYLLIHGTGDDNVHFQNAVEMQNALIKAGKQFDSFIYPNKNHGISGGNTRMHLYQLMTDFIEKNL